MTVEILELMDERRAVKHETEKCKELSRRIRKKCNKEKEKWLNNKCGKIEKLKNKDARNVHQEIKEITGKKNCFLWMHMSQRWKQYPGERGHLD